MAGKTEGRIWTPSLSQRMLAILAASVVAVSAPAAAVFYWFSRDASITEAEHFAQSSTDRRILGLSYTLHLAQTSLARFELMLRDALSNPPSAAEADELRHRVEVNSGGMLASPRSGFDGAREAGIFLNPDQQGDAAFQSLHLRAQRLITQYAGAVIPPLDTLWLLSRNRSGVIFIPHHPDFVARTYRDLDYSQTERLSLSDPAINPERKLRWSKTAFDPVVERWVVSAVLPLDIDGTWVGSIGHDLFLDQLTSRLIGSDELPGTEHFLIDGDGEPIVAGHWQSMFANQQSKQEMPADLAQTLVALRDVAASASATTRSVRSELNGVSVSILTREVPETGWRYVMVTPIASMAGGASRALLLFGLTATAAMLLVATVAHVLLRRQIVRPVRHLAAAMRSFAAGDTAARSSLDRGDDIGALSHAFNTMADRIAAAHSDLTVTQTELQHRNAALVHANRSKSNFLANMSHELRTPLNAIIGFAEILRHQMFGPLGNVRYVSYVEDIERSGQHLLSLINDILDMSRIEAGRQPVRLDHHLLRPLVERGLRMAQPMADHRSVSLEMTADGGDLAANCDSRAVVQMVVNLLSNAVKFSPAGGTVRVRLDRSVFGGATISVADSGPGIDEAVLPHLFEAYAHRAAMTTTRYDGVGLGLAITKALVELHHGSIRVTTQPGHGTTMILELPPIAT